MRTRVKKIIVALLALAMVVTGTIGTDNRVQAATGSTVKLVEGSEFVVIPGETFHVKMSIVATDLQVRNPDMVITAGTAAPFTFTTPSLSMNGTAITSVYSGASSNLEFDVKVKDDAQIGDYPIDITFTYNDILSGDPSTCKITTTLKILEEKNPAQLTIGSVELGDSNIGSKTDLSFTIENEGEITAKSVYLTLNFGDSFEERYTAKSIKVGDLATGETNALTLPISILSTATTGRKTITANFTYKTVDGVAKTSQYNLSVNLTSVANVTQLPKLNIEDVTFAKSLKPSDDFALNVELKNIGGAEAKNIKITVDASSIDASGILKDYFTDGITVDNMNKDVVNSVKVPLTVSKYATGGLKSVKVVISYADAKGNVYSVSDTVYVDVTASATPTPIVGSPNIVISKVAQSPIQPMAGEKVEISFDVLNKGDIDAKEFKIYTEGLTSATFIPIDAEPYQYYETLKAGETIRVTIPLIVSESIVEGLNSITVRYTFTGGEAGSVVIPVRDVKNDIVSISKPKIIVSKYSTDVEELRAGGIFNFTFDLYNTNSSVAAKNITVTISQADNVFNVTQGSNSLFIAKIDPGETVTNTIEMKVKADASTKAYPLEITIEYEYDGAEPNPTTGEIGEKKIEKLNLQAVENSRPVVDNVNVYSWDGSVMVGTTATLAFEFYNMGRSALNNVIAYVEGDFTKGDGEMYFIGNVTEGSSTYVEFDVIPNIEGTANGTLRVTFEDSNGDPVEFTKDFTTEVMSAGFIDNGGIIDNGSGEVFNPEVPIAKQPILPIWAFVLIQVLIFVLFVPITRKVIINGYKAKLRKKEQEKY